ncbi:MAG: peptidoglycan DD-metalloendopeptidase family protein [Kofleriaceae bacterium]|nr:peptidoglycan DD-metalloendopeptidase family protein [Kofleriaceae bacterium]
MARERKTNDVAAMKDDALGMLLLGGGVSALVWSATASRATSGSSTPTLISSAWVFPVPNLGDRVAVISNPFKAGAHLGVDIMFKRRDARDLIAVYPAGSTNGSRMFFMPNDVPALAVSVGVVAFAAMTPVGNSVIVKHSNGWATYYTHLATLAVKRGDAVVAGQQLGTIGASPQDPEHLAHLHLEVWTGGTRASAIDPAPYLAAWPRMVSATIPHGARTASLASRRNGTLSTYRPVGDRGEPYPEWVRALKDEAGVYVIRDADTHEVLYVGSSGGRLYDTLTRHFQIWRRYKGFWRGQFAEGADPGLTYPRGSVEVAVRVTSPNDALDEEMRLIARLRPRDNQIGQPELEDAPF